MKISLIAAVAANGVIGKNNMLPWKLKNDMKHFSSKTRGHHVVMGRKTYESMGRPLPGRTNIIISRNSFVTPCQVLQSLEEAIITAFNVGETELFIIGGAEIYKQALEVADTFYRTRILSDVDGDIKFPIFNENLWDVYVNSGGHADDDNEYPYVIETLTKRRRAS